MTPWIIRTVVGLSLSAAAIGAEPTLQRQIRLTAEVQSSVDPISQIQRVFGKASIQSPDHFEKNHTGFDHIQIGEAPQVGGFFKFYLHRDLDGDRNKSRDETDRQRNEIMGYGGSDEGLKATHGQVARYQWLFRPDSRMDVTPQFCHFFQLKGVGGENASNPFFTLTGAKSNGRKQLELRYWESEQHSAKKFPIAKWSSIAGQWLHCECVVDYRNNGSFRMSISQLEGKHLFQIELDSLRTWREGIEFVRPKWGIYRSLAKAQLIPNEEDSTDFANFLIEEWLGNASDVWLATTRPASP